ncbi:MAG: ATP-binding protein [Gammaproteobacteria bacterium]|nr:ATP-binding protein [Gammaproteobacteria bacterium]
MNDKKIKKPYRFGVSSKLILAFSVFTAAVVLAGSGSIFYINKMGDIFAGIYSENMVVLSRVKELDNDLNKLMINSYKYLGTQDPEKMNTIKIEVEDINSRLRAQFKQNLSSYLTINNKLNEFDAIRTEAFALHFNFNTKLGQELINNSGQVKFAELTALMRKRSLDEQAKAETSLRQGLEIKDGIIIYLITIIILRILLNSTIAYLIYRAVTRPLLELVNFIKKIHMSHDFSLRLNTNSNDEMGDAARAINGLLSSLEKVINEIDSSLHEFSLGNFSRRMEMPLNGHLERLKNSINSTSIVTERSITDINRLMYNVAKGDFSNTLDIELEGELNDLKININDTISTLEKSIHQLEDANNAKTKFLSTMSHELRTPLNAIIGFSQVLLLDNDNLDESQKDNLNEILSAGHHLLNLIVEILDLSRIESGNLDIHIENTNLCKILKGSVNLISPLAAERNIAITLSKDKTPVSFQQLAELNETVVSDPNRLHQILVNLLSNAVKYNNQGGKINIDCSRQSGHVLRLSIRDSGPGLSSEQIHNLFNAFNRLGAEQSTIEGTGIGLVITKKLVELLNGKIGVDSEVGSGSTFWIELPIEAVDHLSEVSKDSLL